MPASGYDWVAFGILESPLIDIASKWISPLSDSDQKEEHNIYPVSSFQFFFMVLLVGASCLHNAYGNLIYTTRKRLKKDIFAIRRLSLNPKFISPLKIHQNLLRKRFLESKKIIIWHDVVSNSRSKHRSNRDNPCEIDKLLKILTGLKKNIEAILYPLSRRKDQIQKTDPLRRRKERRKEE